MVYVSEPLETDSNAIAAEAYAWITARFPNWSPQDGNLDARLIEAWAQNIAELREIETDVRDQIYRYFGATLHGILPIDATPAVADSTWTMVDDAGYTIPAGTQVAIPAAGDDFKAFVVVSDVTVPAGSTATAAGEVPLEAADEGADSSNLSGTPELIDSLDYVADGGIVLVGETSGGVDAEADEDYLNRLTEELRLLSPAPIIPSDFSVLARRVAGVRRAVTVDLYNPAHNSLSLNQASVETDATGWAADTNCSITRSTSQAADGTASLRLSSTAGGDMKATTPTGTGGEPVTGNDELTAVASFRAAAAPRSVRVEIFWYTAAGAAASTASNAGTSVADTTAGFTQASVTARAPVNAAFAAVKVTVLATGGASELHYVDKIAFRRGTSTVWAAGGSPAEGNERMVTVVPADIDGDPLGSGIKAEIKGLLESLREANFVVNVIDASYTAIAVAFTGVAYEGWELDDVEARAIAALAAYLDPSTWGDPEQDDTGEWVNDTVVRYGEVYGVLDRVEGLHYVTDLDLAIEGSGGGSEQNIQLAGIVALPTPGTIASTVTAP